MPASGFPNDTDRSATALCVSGIVWKLPPPAFPMLVCIVPKITGTRIWTTSSMIASGAAERT